MSDIRERVARAICASIDAHPDVENSATLGACRLAADAALSACGYAEMRAEIERLRAMTTWRPIEEANKQSLDAVMIFNPSSYQGKGGMFIGIFMATRDSGGPHWFCHPSSVKAEPTHFLPLPPPPEGDKK